MFNWWAWIVPATKSRENEKFWEFLKGHDIYACELKDRGEYGVEAQIFKNAELLASYRHETSVGRTVGESQKRRHREGWRVTVTTMPRSVVNMVLAAVMTAVLPCSACCKGA